MELSEAKEALKNIKRCCFEDEQYQKYGFMELYTDISDVKAIDTVLKALDNSISKDEVRKLLNIIEIDEEIAMSNEDEKIVNELQYLKGKIKELLGGDE